MTDPLGEPPSWVADAIFYQVFPDRFARSGRVPAPGPLEDWGTPPTLHGFKGGDLYGVVDHLDHLDHLGVTAIYLNPVFASAANHRYHTYDYLRVDPLLGGDEALRALLDAAHRRGMRVILDGVFNHASRGFWPFHHVLEGGGDSPYREWFHLNRDDLDAGRPLRAYPANDARHGSGADSLSAFGYRAWWDLPALPKLNTENPEVREYLMLVAEHWTRFGIDGWRLDVPEEITTAGFWQELRRRVRAIDPDAYLVAEIWQERPDLLDGSTYDGLMNYPLASAILGYAAGDRLARRVLGQQPELARQVTALDGAGFLARVEAIVAAYEPRFVRSHLTLLDSHDTPRFLTLAGHDRGVLRLAWLVLMTMPGAPCIFYGDEIGMAGEHDPGCRGAFPWDRAAWDASLLETLRSLIHIRREMPSLRSAELAAVGASGPAAAYRRGNGAGAAIVATNPGPTPASLEVPCPGSARRASAVPIPNLGPAVARPIDDDLLRLELPPRSGMLLRIG